MTPTNYNHIGLYPTIKMQSRNRWDNWAGYLNPNPLTTLPTISVTSTGGLSSARLYTENAASSQDVGACFSTTVVAHPSLGNVNVYTTNTTAIPTPITNGKYYLLLVVNGVSYYSDLIHFCDSVTGYTKIEYSHNEDFFITKRTLAKTAVIPQDYVTTIYLDSHVARPSYPYSEDVSEFSGVTKPKQQISYKQRKIIHTMPEYLCDALRIARLMDNVSVTYGGVEYECDEFLMGDPVWQVGEVGAVTIEFKTETITAINGRR